MISQTSARSTNTSSQKRVKWIATILCEIFALITIAAVLITRKYSRLLMALCAVVLFLLPFALEAMFHCSIHLSLFIFALLYALGPVLGNCWRFYDLVPGWDKLLHICGGVVFAILGFFLFGVIAKNGSNPLAAAVFALCFSMAVAMLWEGVEFTADVLFHTDMQRDTWVSDLHSYMFGLNPGDVGSLENITCVTVNGTPLPRSGYLDIGLIDTMLDMLVETLGALAACILIFLDRGRHSLIQTVARPQAEGTL